MNHVDNADHAERRTLELPRLVAGRDLADRMVDNLLGDVTGEVVVIDASRLLSGTSSYAAQLVRRILVDGDAGELVLAGSPESFGDYIAAAARDLGVVDRVGYAPVMTIDLAAS